jgi:hypothetical protein
MSSVYVATPPIPGYCAIAWTGPWPAWAGKVTGSRPPGSWSPGRASDARRRPGMRLIASAGRSGQACLCRLAGMIAGVRQVSGFPARVGRDLSDLSRNRSTMLIFVPPSETKAFPAEAAPVELGSLALPELTSVRARLLKALIRLARGRAPAALEALGLSPSQSGELAHNRELLSAPAGVAAACFSPVTGSRTTVARQGRSCPRRARCQRLGARRCVLP